MAQATGRDALHGQKILVVEDEYFLADDLAQALLAEGAVVIGPVGTLEEAAAAIEREHPDKAVLDMNLRGQMAYAIADRLDAASVPFVIATGYSGESLPERLRGKPRVEKPFDLKRLVAMMAGGGDRPFDSRFDRLAGFSGRAEEASLPDRSTRSGLSLANPVPNDRVAKDASSSARPSVRR